MKKTIVAVLAMLMMFLMASGASAANSASFTITVPSQGSGTDPLYYDETGFIEKTGDSNVIYIGYHIVDAGVNETNRVAVFDLDSQRVSMYKWLSADGALYPYTSNSIVKGHHYTAAFRANSNYATKYGLDTVTITGRICED